MRSYAEPRRALQLAACAWLVLATPAARAWLEASMPLHMLVQLPLLAVIGYCVGWVWRAAPSAGAQRMLGRVQSFDAGGVTGLLVAAFAMLPWMLPRSLDMARLDPAVDALKLLSVPAAGLAIAISWPRVPVVARAVVHLEAIATLLRFGWGYLAADERLCLAYLAGDQQRTGELLLWAGALYAVGLAWRPFFGKPQRPPSSRGGAALHRSRPPAAPAATQ